MPVCIGPNYADMLSTLKLGLPIAMTILFEVTLFGVVALLLSPFGALTVAAHQIAPQLLLFDVYAAAEYWYGDHYQGLLFVR